MVFGKIGRKSHLRRSVIQNWKIKKFLKHDGHVYYKIYFRSMLGFWLELKDSACGYDGSYSVTVTFKSEDEAKQRIREEIGWNLAQAGSYVHNVEEIRFDRNEAK